MSDAPPPSGPVRTCIGCRARRPQDQLIRLHLDGDRLRLGRTGPGRGAWVCAATAAACLRQAQAGRAVGRALRRRVDPDSIEVVVEALEEGGPG